MRFNQEKDLLCLLDDAAAASGLRTTAIDSNSRRMNRLNPNGIRAMTGHCRVA
jgi:hypothetical protein